MKTIIHKGINTYHGHCTECGCEFTYERSDVGHNYVRGGDWVSCPSCGHSCYHFGEGGTSRPTDSGRRRHTWSVPSPHRCNDWSMPLRGGYQPSGLLPRGSCFR
jgi:hypothetical protein